METVLNLNELCLTYVATVNFQLMAFKYSRKTSHIGTVQIYMSSVAYLSYLRLQGTHIGRRESVVFL